MCTAVVGDGMFAFEMEPTRMLQLVLFVGPRCFYGEMSPQLRQPELVQRVFSSTEAHAPARCALPLPDELWQAPLERLLTGGEIGREEPKSKERRESRVREFRIGFSDFRKTAV